MDKQKVIIWTTGIDDLMKGEGQVGGLTVQMMFWAFSFHKESFKVYTLTEWNKRKFKSLNLLKTSSRKRLSILFETLNSIYYIIKIRPNIILFRGASRGLFIISYLCTLFKIKLVFMGASDVNFITGKENVAGRNYNKKLYRKGLKKTKYFAVQNKNQVDSLFENYKKESICIPNIWENKIKNNNTKELIIWVGNFRNLKRPKWFINLAEKFPDQQFAMAGFPVNKELNTSCANHSSNISNLIFLGPLTFKESEELFDKAKLLVCTSEYEGFPNTFLQAWSRNVPILSTVDPSNLIYEKKLGYFIKNEGELYKKLDLLIKNKALTDEIACNISQYFQESHNPKIHINRLLKYIK